MNEALRTALAVAADGWPVFPVNPKSKRPAISNAQLAELYEVERIPRGQGGLKMATTDTKTIKKMWAAAPGASVAVPMGTPTGLVCVDVDLYKGADVERWHDAHWHLLEGTRAHRSQNGGMHYLFARPSFKLPQKIIDGVDVKGEGGYIVWPPSAGYSISSNHGVQAMPEELLHEARSRPTSGTGTFSNGDDTATLVHRLVSAEDFHDTLRTLSARMVTQGASGSQALDQLRAVMDASAAATPGHPRHEDWEQRRAALPRMVEGAVKKFGNPLVDVDLSELASLSVSDVNIISEHRKQVRAELSDDEVVEYTLEALHNVALPPIDWLMPGVLPFANLVSLAGNSGVGKTRWLAALAVCVAAGCTGMMGLPEVKRAVSVMWFANEERRVDIARRMRATAIHYGVQSGCSIFLRGKERGPLRLAVLDDHGQPVVNDEVVDWVIERIRASGAMLVFFDPYVTLSSGVDENSSAGADVINSALQRISGETGACVLHAHHTPKDRALPADWYRSSPSAWRGSGAIYTSLDMGLTLAQWVPQMGSNQQKQAYKELQRSKGMALGRWNVLDMGKVREGGEVDSVVYHMQSEPMPEGGEIGVTRLASELEAQAAYAELLSRRIAENLGAGTEGDGG